MENFIIKFTNKYISFYDLFKVRGAWNKAQLLQGDVVGKKLRNISVRHGDAGVKIYRYSGKNF